MARVSAHRPLSTYVAGLGGAGLAITAVREFGSREIPWLLVAESSSYLKSGARDDRAP